VSRTKSDWDRALSHVPYADHARWPELLQANPEVLHRIIADAYDVVLREEEKLQGVRRSGRRPKPSMVPVTEVLSKVFPQQYSALPFREALAELIGGESQRQFAKRVPTTQATISRLLSGEFKPDLVMMERLATAAAQGPWYFLEWRAGYVGALVAEALVASPSTGVQAIRAIRLLARRPA
jgi:transcriptional regulator with XRE-family HTH domain